MRVMIGVDPHKGSHTAVAIDQDEAGLAKVKVRATRRQVDQLLEWAARFDERTWAVESAGGLGYLLAQQLLNAGERVLDVPATLAARAARLRLRAGALDDPDIAQWLGAGVGDGTVEQERSQRRVLRGGRGAAGAATRVAGCPR